MKASSLVLSLAAAAIASAQDCSVSEPFYNITSKPFHLLVKSQDGKVDDTLSACHVGAALESLCLSNAKSPSNTSPLAAADFYFNTSVYSQAPDASLTVPGILVWDLPTTTMNVSSSAAFEYDPISTLATPILSPGSDRPTLLAFDSNDFLILQAYVRGENNTGSYQEFYRWTTTIASRPTVNTQPCNGYVEFCNRKFSNVSMVVAHNSPFVKPHNAASNQIYPVLTQLQDGIRGLQFETHMPNETSPIRLCHTSCNLLDVGLLETYLATVKSWLDANPYEVIAIMMGNNNDASFRITPEQYSAAFSASGILEYIWTPPAASMNLSSWPTLSEMILKRQRVVVMLDYNADQSTVPWLLDEWNYQWQTPFSPTNPSFPCTQQRPPGQSAALSRQRMYMVNHNLNINVSLQGIPDILIPAYSLLDEVNAVEGNASVGRNVRECADLWNRPPNWILVDYYNFGNFNGSVFEVAAEANGVPFRKGRCCGGLAASKAGLGRGIAGGGIWGLGGLWVLWWLW
ncbi:uncharacterized protein yc1106_08656 [Curvularia clavata]|uniref:PLC-like phosphodiesterase n=1 Tax=Curvularia clavata TaxID=95742 RepID=A0A9Q9DW04_CURCL|nr:uncharacterized protein yc1106_08656 [Curvularia clavata]